MSAFYKLLLSLILGLNLASNVPAQPNWAWQKRVGEKFNVQRLNQITLNQEGDIATVGTMRSGGVYFGIFEPTTGGLLSETTLNSKNTSASALLQTRDGGYVVVGQTASKAGWLAKLDASGALIWEEFYGGAEARSFTSVVHRGRER